MKPIFIYILIFIVVVVLICAVFVSYQIIEDKKNKPRTVTSNHLRQMCIIINNYVSEKGKLPPQAEFVKVVKEYGGEDEVLRTGLAPDFQAASLSVRDLSRDLRAGDMEHLDRRIDQLGQSDGAVRRLPLDHRGP